MKQLLFAISLLIFSVNAIDSNAQGAYSKSNIPGERDLRRYDSLSLKIPKFATVAALKTNINGVLNDSSGCIAYVVFDSSIYYFTSHAWVKIGTTSGGSFLPLIGGTMTGKINMGANNITNVDTILCNGIKIKEDVGGASMTLNVLSILNSDEVATFQNVSGVVAYLSDIAAQNLTTVLSHGNSAGTNSINMNGNSIRIVDSISGTGSSSLKIYNLAGMIINPGSMKVNINGPAIISGSSGTPTTITGRDVSGNIGNVAVGSGLSLSGGTLTAAGGGVAAGIGITVSGSTVNTKPITRDSVGGNLIGNLYNKNTWSDLSDFTDNSSGATANATKVDFTGGAGNFAKNLDINYFTCLERWKMTAKMKVVTTGNGFGVGTISTNPHGASNLNAYITTSGLLMSMQAGANVQVATGTGTAISTNDYVIMTLERNVNVATFTFRNVTKNSVTTSVTYTYTTSSTGTATLPNTGKFCIYNLGGNFTLDSLSVTSNDVKNATLGVLGDSKAEAYSVTSINDRYSNKLANYYSPMIVSAGIGDGTAEILSRITEIENSAPRQVLLALGSNNERYGISHSTTFTQYDSIVAHLNRAGCVVIHLLSMYEPALNESYIDSYKLARYPNSCIALNGLRQPFMIASDSIHPNTLGNGVVFDAIINSNKLVGVPVGSFNSIVSNVAVSSLGSATSTNTIDNGNKTQEWQWNSLAGTGFKIHVTSPNAASNSLFPLWVEVDGANATATQTTYAGVFRNLSTGTGSTNVAGFFSAGSGAHNYAIIASGLTGLGTNTPTQQLHVSGTETSGIGLNALIENTGNTGLPLAGVFYDVNAAHRGYICGSQTYFNTNGLVNGLNIGAGAADQDISFRAGACVGNTATAPSMIIDSVENVGIGVQHPVSRFSIGSSSQFQINSSGNPIKINNVTTSFPSSQGAANTNLTNDGSGNLTWSINGINGQDYFTPSTGGTVSLTNHKYNIINPSGALLALTVNLPSSPSDDDRVEIKFTQSVTTVTYGNGTVVDGITSPIAGGFVVLKYRSATSSWY